MGLHSSEQMPSIARNLWLDRRVRFLVIGGANTASGYAVFAALYYVLSPHLHYLCILSLATVVNVTISYINLKHFVFRTTGNWLAEYLRFYLVYAVPITLGFVLFPLLVNGLGINAYLAQGMILAVTVVVSYLGHSRVSFQQFQTSNLTAAKVMRPSISAAAREV